MGERDGDLHRLIVSDSKRSAANSEAAVDNDGDIVFCNGASTVTPAVIRRR